MRLGFGVAAAVCLMACDGSDGLAPARLAASQAGPPLTLRASDVGVDATVTFEISGAVAGERVKIARSSSGVGAGPCLAAFGGACLNLVNPALLTSVTIDSDGYADKELNVPNVSALVGATVCFQAIAVRGVDGAQTELSSPVCVDAGYDDDSDGVLNGDDTCAGGDDYYDWDLDGVADDCDRVSDRPPVYEEAVYPLPVTRRTFQGRNTRQVIPANPVGIVFVFHGSGGDAEFLENVETTALGAYLVDQGLGVVALTSEDRSPARWDATTGPNQNADWDRIRALRGNLISRGDISQSTKVFALGFSNGGSMASYVGHAGVAQGWPMGGLAFIASGGSSPYYGAAPNLASYFVSMVNDDVVPPSDIQSNYQRHLNLGRPGRYVNIQEQQLAPTRFARSEYFTADQSEDFFRLFVRRGFYDKSGTRLFSVNALESNITDAVELPAFTYPRPGRSVLNPVHALHAMNAGATEGITSYFLNQI